VSVFVCTAGVIGASIVAAIGLIDVLAVLAISRDDPTELDDV
jgi:hypothetical protein